MRNGPGRLPGRLTSHEVIVNTIAATTTATGLTVRAALDPGSYPDGVKVSNQQLACLRLDRHDWHGDWNYTLRPSRPRSAQPPHRSRPWPGSPPTPRPTGSASPRKPNKRFK